MIVTDHFVIIIKKLDKFLKVKVWQAKININIL